MAQKEKISALDAAVKSIKDMFGAESISINEPLPGIQWVSSQSIALDRALGGGFARGRIIEILGQESSAKTTCCLHLIAEIQQLGGVAAFLDVENACDPIYAENLGVNTKDLIVSQPDTAEQTLNIAEILIRSGEVDLIVVDSVAALVPAAELEGTFDDQQMGLQARMMSKAMRKLTGITAQHGTILVFTNQYRSGIGHMAGKKSSGGNALKYFASQRIELNPNFKNRIVTSKSGDAVAVNITAKVIKNKVAPPLKQAELTVVYGKGICPYTEVVNLAIQQKILTKAGAWLRKGEETFSNGLQAAVDRLSNDPELFQQMKNLVLGIVPEESEPGDEEEAEVHSE